MSILSTILLSKLRDKTISRAAFRDYSNQLAHCLAQQAAEHLSTTKTKVETPLDTADGKDFDRPIILVPILRSGLVLVPAFSNYFHGAAIGCIGLRRDEKTAIASLYYQNLPKLTGNEHILMLDPMIATGGSAVAALNILTKQGIKQQNIIFVGIIAAQEGIDNVRKSFSKITLLVTATDPYLNQDKFIVPGLGDFGDRYFGTE